MRSWKLILISLMGLVAGALVLGFLTFATLATRAAVHEAGVKADGIVAFTGGAQRIGEAGRLLRAGRAKRLLITGVNRMVSRQQLRRLLGVDEALFNCCIDIDYAAQNTRGNAIETRKWVKRHNFASVIVVTASYHMPRSLTELGHMLPAADLIAHPVVPARFRETPWWLDQENLQLLGAEYLKYLPSATQYGIGRLLGPRHRADGQPDAQKAVAIQ